MATVTSSRVREKRLHCSVGHHKSRVLLGYISVTSKCLQRPDFAGADQLVEFVSSYEVR
jgi:hypothetical protein